MFKKTLIACAASLMISGAVFAGDFGGRFSGNDGQAPFGIVLTEQGSQVAGKITFSNGAAFDMTGTTDGRTVRGSFRGNGREVPFVMTSQNGRLVLSTSSTDYVLQRESAQVGTASNNNPFERPQDNNGFNTNGANTNVFDNSGFDSRNDQPAAGAQVHRGQYFEVSLPQGWRFQESPAQMVAGAPDGSAALGFAIVSNAQGVRSASDAVRGMAQQFGLQNVRVISQKPWEGQNGIKGLDVEMTYSVNGQSLHGIWSVSVCDHGDRVSVVSSMASAPAQIWSQNGQTLIAMMNSIKLVPQQQQQQPSYNNGGFAGQNGNGGFNQPTAPSNGQAPSNGGSWNTQAPSGQQQIGSWQVSSNGF
jgi:hypothetical protein